MNDPYRFHLPDLSAVPLQLPEDQAHHAARVLRLEDGAAVVVFDGRGGWAQATLHPAGKQMRVKLTSDIYQDPPPTRALTLATAVPKGDRAEWLIEQASQLNVTTIQWLDADRSVVRPKDSGGKMDKWKRLAIESAKQCGRTHVMKIEPMRTLDELLQSAAGISTRLWLEPRSTLAVQAAIPPIATTIIAFIGPEGGWSERELQLAAAQPNLAAVHLTPTVLRVETASAALAAIVACADSPS
jgi:16S rRNA (uracil1498-N3)-methyltransferase